MFFCCYVGTWAEASCLMEGLALISVLGTKHTSGLMGQYCFSNGSTALEYFISEPQLPASPGRGLCPEMLVQDFVGVWM